jgi:hypothetical protein
MHIKICLVVVAYMNVGVMVFGRFPLSTYFANEVSISLNLPRSDHVLGKATNWRAIDQV